MLQRYSFFVIFTLLVSGLSWWARSLEGSLEASRSRQLSAAQESETRSVSEIHRRELLEVLDRIVAYEHYYHSVYGHFTKLLSRIGTTIPKNISSLYEIRVAEATTERLLITALAEIQGKTADVVSVDQSYRVHASFPIPKPRAEFLRFRAQSYLRQLSEAPAGQTPEEQGIFKGFFKYEVRPDSRNQRVAFAVGIRYPVLGLELESGGVGASFENGVERLESQALLADLGMDFTPEATGQQASGAVMTSSEEVYLAQRIFKGEVGRYAKSWSELSRIASFDFNDPSKPQSRNLSSIHSESQVKGPLKSDLEIESISDEN